MTDPNRNELVELTADIIAAYVANHFITTAELPDLVERVHCTLKDLRQGTSPAEREKPKPEVPIRKSVTEDHIICLEDGRKFKSLKRHLAISHDMTPEEYRARWNLPADYPMIAPSYAAARSGIARATGLGRKKS